MIYEIVKLDITIVTKEFTEKLDVFFALDATGITLEVMIALLHTSELALVSEVMEKISTIMQTVIVFDVFQLSIASYFEAQQATLNHEIYADIIFRAIAFNHVITTFDEFVTEIEALEGVEAVIASTTFGTLKFVMLGLAEMINVGVAIVDLNLVWTTIEEEITWTTEVVDITFTKFETIINAAETSADVKLVKGSLVFIGFCLYLWDKNLLS